MRESQGNGYNPEDFIKKDGARQWHRRFVGIESPESGRGACIWVGSANEKNVIEAVSGRKYGNADRRIFSSQGIANHFKSVPDYTSEPVHGDHPCGNEWIGIAQYPLPKDYAHPLSEWSGWTHIVHNLSQFNWNLPEGFMDTFFDISRKVIEKRGYPSDLGSFTRSILTQDSLRVVVREELSHDYKTFSEKGIEDFINEGFYNNHFIFPWVNNELGLRQPAFE